jgi:flagellar biogenesis protein FliO
LKVKSGKLNMERERLLRGAFLFVLFVASVPFALAQSFPGTKPDPTGASAVTQSSGSGIGSLFNVLLALGIVYGLLRFAMPKVMARMSRRLVTGAGSAIRIEESATFAGGSLYVVSARGKTLLLGVGSQGVQNLADLTDPTPKPEPETFGEIVERELSFAPKAVVSDPSDLPNTPHPTPDTSPDWAVALERLERLSN